MKVKTFKKSYCPEWIDYKGEVLSLEGYYSAIITTDKRNPKDIVKELTSKGNTACIVEIHNPKLKGKLDLYGQPYKPTQLIFSNHLTTT